MNKEASDMIYSKTAASPDHVLDMSTPREIERNFMMLYGKNLQIQFANILFYLEIYHIMEVKWLANAVLC